MGNVLEMQDAIPTNQLWMVIAGFIIAFILAFGIGANDVANSFGTSVGSRVLTLRQAFVLACIFETLGAVLLGAKVSDTIRKGIIDVTPYSNNTELLMIGNVATLSGSCIWLIIATIARMPVSATHSIVGSTVGFALVAHGTEGIQWGKLGMIVGSWFISPILAGIVSISLFCVCKYFILCKQNSLEPGLRFLPVFYAVTVVVNLFSVFYQGPTMLGFDKIPLWGTFILSFGAGIICAIVVRVIVVPWLRKRIKAEVTNLSIESSTSDDRPEFVLGGDNDVISGTAATALDGVVNDSWVTNGGGVANGNCVVNGIGDIDGGAGDCMMQTKIADKHDSPEDNVIRRNSVRKSSIGHSTPSRPGDTHSDRHHVTTPRSREKIKSGGSRKLEVDDEVPLMMRNESDLSVLPSKNSTVVDLNKELNSDAVSVRYATAVSVTIDVSCQPNSNDATDTKIATTADGVYNNHLEQGRLAIKDQPETLRLFSFLQILTAVFGAFAHGGNDVSNAIGPLVSLWLIGTSGLVLAKASTPIWILLYGGIGISLGLVILGRRVIETVGSDLAKITPSSGFCIEIGSALTVLIASNIGIPISTTHCKVGSVVFVGRFRSKENVNWVIFRNIFFAWVVTLPISGGLSALFMFLLRLTLKH